jgi:hypothetical protein
MARVKAGCATLQRPAALVKFSVSLTAKKYRIWCISKVLTSLYRDGGISRPRAKAYRGPSRRTRALDHCS